MSAFLGNLDGFLQFLERGTLRSMDYWRSSRVVAKGDTINEFPFFSTIHGDLHPHFMVLPVGILLLAILLDERLFPSRADERRRAARGARWCRSRSITFVLGAMVAISNWELPMGVLVVALLAGRAQPLITALLRARASSSGCALIGVLIGVYVLFMPFYLDFVPPLVTPGTRTSRASARACFTDRANVARRVPHRVRPAALPPMRARHLAPVRAAKQSRRRERRAGGEGRHLAIAAAGLAIVFRGHAPATRCCRCWRSSLAGRVRGRLLGQRRRRAAPAICSSSPGTAALLACEVAFLKDSYGEKLYRMNTVFKLYFQGWTILAIAAPWALGRLLERRWNWAPTPRVIVAATALLVGGVSLLSARHHTRSAAARRTRRLNGNAYLARDHPDDFAAIEWLRQQRCPIRR